MDSVADLCEKRGWSPEVAICKAYRHANPYRYVSQIPLQDARIYRNSVDPARHGGRRGEPRIPEYFQPFYEAECAKIAQAAPLRRREPMSRPSPSERFVATHVQ